MFGENFSGSEYSGKREIGSVGNSINFLLDIFFRFIIRKYRKFLLH
jgi:hypothetical protein